MRLHKNKLNDGLYDYFWGSDLVEIADELTETPKTIYIYIDYYQFRDRLTKLVFSLKKMNEYSRFSGDFYLHKTVTMWKKGINIFTKKLT